MADEDQARESKEKEPAEGSRETVKQALEHEQPARRARREAEDADRTRQAPRGE